MDVTATDLILKRAKGIEVAVYNDFGGTTAQYKSKLRSLYVNLKDVNNPGLRESVVSGDVTAERFAKMTSQVRAASAIFLLRILTIAFRKWLQRSEKLQITRSKKKICITLLVRRSSRPKQTRSSARSANRCVVHFPFSS